MDRTACRSVWEFQERDACRLALTPLNGAKSSGRDRLAGLAERASTGCDEAAAPAPA
jgi:hypothetical protein